VGPTLTAAPTSGGQLSTSPRDGGSSSDHPPTRSNRSTPREPWCIKTLPQGGLRGIHLDSIDRPAETPAIGFDAPVMSAISAAYFCDCLGRPAIEARKIHRISAEFRFTD